jgi:hypothetical protein
LPHAFSYFLFARSAPLSGLSLPPLGFMGTSAEVFAGAGAVSRAVAGVASADAASALADVFTDACDSASAALLCADGVASSVACGRGCRRRGTSRASAGWRLRCSRSPRALDKRGVCSCCGVSFAVVCLSVRYSSCRRVCGSSATRDGRGCRSVSLVGSAGCVSVLSARVCSNMRLR